MPRKTKPPACTLHPKYKAARPPTSTKPDCTRYEAWAAARVSGEKISAEALINARARGTAKANPSDAALAELRKVIEYNDACNAPTKRVSAALALDMLASYGWEGSITSLNRICREALGRRTYGTP